MVTVPSRTVRLTEKFGPIMRTSKTPLFGRSQRAAADDVLDHRLA
jgi:hypothetical protein